MWSVRLAQQATFKIVKGLLRAFDVHLDFPQSFRQALRLACRATAKEWSAEMMVPLAARIAVLAASPTIQIATHASHVHEVLPEVKINGTI